MMKTTFKLILVAVCVTFLSCQKDVNLSTGNSSITSDGVISGKIVNYIPNSIDSVKAWNIEDVGTGKVSKDEFSIRLTVPQLHKVVSSSGATVSDTTAMAGSMNMSVRAYLNNNFIGEVIKCNFTTDSIITTGMAYSIFMYADRTFTYKGTHIETYTSNNKTETSTSFYNVTFKKGWNEVVYKITSNTSTVNSKALSVSFTNIIPSDLQWHFFKSNYSNVRGELPGNGKVRAEKTFLFK